MDAWEYGKSPQAEQALQRQVRELGMLHAVAIACGQGTEEDELIARVTNIVGETLGSTSFGVGLLDPASGRVTFHPSYRLEGKKRVAALPYRQGIVGRVAASGRPWRVPDVRAEPAYVEEDPQTRSELCVPLKVGKRIIGVINTESRDRNAFTGDDERLLATCAGQLATALDRLRTQAALYETGERYRSLFEHVPVGLYRATPRGKILDANPALVQMIGFADRESLLAYPASELYVKPGARTAWQGLLERDGLVRNFEMQMRRRDGAMIWVRNSAQIVRDGTGHTLYYEGSLEDITARKHLEQQVEERRLYLENVLSCAPDAIVTLDAQHRILEWNQGARELFGYEPKETIGWNLDDLIAASDASMLKQATGFTRMVLGGEPLAPTETVRYRKDGTPLRVIVSGSPIVVDGKLSGVVAIYTDITRRLQAETALKRSRRLLQTIYDAIPDAVVVTDADFIIVSCNRSVERVLGYQPEELVGQSYVTLVPDAMLAHPQQRDREARLFEQGYLEEREDYLFVRKDGQVFSASFSVTLLRDEQGRLTGAVGTIRDVSERKQAEEEIRRWAAHLEVLNTVIASAVAAHDLPELLATALDHILFALKLEIGAIWLGDQTVLRSVDADMDLAAHHKAQFNLPDLPAAIAAEDWRRCKEPDPLSSMAAEMERLGVRASLTVPILADRQRIGGLSAAATEPRAWTSNEIALLEAVGRQLGTTAERLRLLEEVRRQARELEIAVAQLQELDRLKNEFMQNVSHELRTPLALIWGYTELLLDGEMGSLLPAQRGAIDSIARQAQALSNLVEDITLILGAEARSAEQVPVAMDDLISIAVQDFQVAADQAELTLLMEVDPELPPVLGASFYLQRMLDNLLSNAIKFTPAGGRVTVRGHRQADWVVVQVIDTGIGIPPDEQARIFERFYQVDGSARRHYGGIGLGLALVKEIVDTHQGMIQVDSEVGRGTVFTVALPIAPEPGA
jgi:PAS domain S-box-containing protein